MEINNSLLPAPAESPVYRSYLHRFSMTVRRRYNYRNPLHIVAAAVYVLTQSFGLEPFWRDLSRYMERDRSPVPPLTGSLPRLVENITGMIQDMRRWKLISAFFKLWNFIGDATSDGVDLVTGVSLEKNRVRLQIHQLLKESPRLGIRISHLARSVRARIARMSGAGTSAFQIRLKYFLIRRTGAKIDSRLPGDRL